MTPEQWTHIEIIAGIAIPLGSGILYVIWQQAQMALKVDLMFDWFSNHGHDITGYQPGDEKKKK
jgi:hypothetical protein